MKSEPTRVISGPEAQALAFCQSRDRQTLEAGELVSALRWPAAQERKVLSRLSAKGLVVRVRRGLYLVPPRLPPGGRWSPGEFLALQTLMNDRDGRYQISGASAFYRYGWTEQVPNRVYVYNNRISGDREIGAANFTLIKVADDRLGGTEIVKAPDGLEVAYASRARALFDAVYDWSRFDTLPRSYRWIEREADREGFVSELVQVTTDYGNQVTIRRIGAALERANVAESLLRKLERKLTPASAYALWNPNRERQGETNKRWEIVFNDD